MKKLPLKYGFIVLVAAAIGLSTYLFKQSVLRVLPLFISLIVTYMTSKVNRYGYLLGSLNSILYGAVYFYYRIYGSMFSALFINFPLQIVIFAVWSRRKYKSSTILRAMKPKMRIFLAAGVAVGCGLIVTLLRVAGSAHSLLDAAVTALGLVSTVLTLFAFVEYSYISLIHIPLSLALNLSLALEKPEMFTYVIYSVYNLVCAVIGFINIRKLYAEQQTKKQGDPEHETLLDVSR